MDLWIFGTPGNVGGASTKILHLIRLLHLDFKIRVIAPERSVVRNKEVLAALSPFGVECMLWKDVPTQAAGVALAICDAQFFSSGHCDALKKRGFRVVWSNEMMFPIEGDLQAAKNGLIDRVLFVSEFQAKAFGEIRETVPFAITGNYIDSDDYVWRPREHPLFTMGRLSRADPNKFPRDFPVFYEEIGLRDVRYRIMAWSPQLQKQYSWHRFGPEWEFLPANKQSARSFLYSLDIFLYPLGHTVQESWGRAVVEAMLTGAVPVVPSGHQFHKLMVHGESGFICSEFREFKAVVRELYENYPLRVKVSREASSYARAHICRAEEHRKKWVQALTF